MTTSTLTPNLADFADVISAATPAQITADPTLDGRLTLARSERLTISYAPFEPINADARLVLCGITPGRSQAVAALHEARRQLRRGVGPEDAARAAKATASFAGPMRNYLVAMIDDIGLSTKFGLQSADQLFGTRKELVHHTSALRYPVFVDAKNYNGRPALGRHPLLVRQVSASLANEARLLPKAVWLPLGPVAEAALALLIEAGLLSSNRVIGGLEHASPANAERIAYFLGRKPRTLLSKQTNPDRIDAGRARALSFVGMLPQLA